MFNEAETCFLVSRSRLVTVLDAIEKVYFSIVILFQNVNKIKLVDSVIQVFHVFTDFLVYYLLNNKSPQNMVAQEVDI